MTEQTGSSGSPFVRALGGFLRFLVRLIFVLVIGMLIGLGLFYGIPWAYRRLVWPVQENSARIAILEEQVAKNSEGIFDNHRALQDRIVDLEIEGAELQEEIAAQAQDQQALQEAEQRLTQHITGLEEDLVVLGEDVQAQQQKIDQVRSEVTGTASALEEIAEVQEQLAEAQQELLGQVETFDETLDDVQGQLDASLARLSLLQTAQDLLKVRLLLVEDNPGAARDTLELAMAHLAHASELVPSEGAVLDDLRERLTAIDDLIAERSFRARPSLEALWADTMDLVTPLGAQSVITETQATSPLPTPTPSP